MGSILTSKADLNQQLIAITKTIEALEKIHNRCDAEKEAEKVDSSTMSVSCRVRVPNSSSRSILTSKADLNQQLIAITKTIKALNEEP
jgi:hypothetical protein